MQFFDKSKVAPEPAPAIAPEAQKPPPDASQTDVRPTADTGQTASSPASEPAVTSQGPPFDSADAGENAAAQAASQAEGRPTEPPAAPPANETTPDEENEKAATDSTGLQTLFRSGCFHVMSDEFQSRLESAICEARNEPS